MNTKFEELEIKLETKQAISDLGLIDLTPIQALAIPKMIDGLDFIAEAQTGTGKTFAFAIPIIEKIKLVKETQSLVLCPTRELAIQVYNEFLKLVKYQKDILVAPIVGGESYERQFTALKKKPHIIIGTPGRIIDHLNRGTIDFSKLTQLTFDEADEMLKMGFKEDLEAILQNAPKERQTTLFSATIPQEIKRIAKEYQNNSSIIKAESETLTATKIIQNYYVVKKEDKMKLLERLLDISNMDSNIIFANTKREVDEITEFLREKKFNANSLHGDMKQKERSYVTSNFRNKQLNILVATDVAARGLDIKNVGLVINYDYPQEDEIYVHRIGRTGRAGSEGLAYTLLTPRTEHKIKQLEKFTKTTINKLEIPSEKIIAKALENKLIISLKKEVVANTNTYDKIINEFEQEGISKDALLNALLDKLVPSKKVYEVIEEPKQKKSNLSDSDNKKKDRKDSNRKPSKLKDNAVLVKVNLGRKDKITPLIILDMFGSIYNIRNNNIGDIKHYQTYTVVELSSKGHSFINNKTFKYKGKNIKIEEV
ncbi:DEAD/DEAH box helicase [Haploplasma modicum]|uniref:DEAD/DEAH box helicase n=1 Tax=Haploplasma modicum TaxID=2150 RepID=UPI0004798879|nr:DEAD/DEAH box helicase [Haploplasma modicum]